MRDIEEGLNTPRIIMAKKPRDRAKMNNKMK